MSIRFAGCTLDLDARRLFRGAREVHLSPKAFEFLKVLVESRPRAVSKAELLERVWAGTFVADASLARTVNEIRDGLGGRRGRVVRTVHGYGYAFAGEVEEETAHRAAIGTASPPRVCLTSRDQEFPLRDGDLVAGRDAAVEICLPSSRVSRRHARFVVNGTTVTVEDLGSKNGTFVNGTGTTGCVVLKDGDQIRIGPFTFVLNCVASPWSTETEASVTIPTQRIE
jgi:DNA-binding winged helix-turn-helix (wHTH) protein